MEHHGLHGLRPPSDQRDCGLRTGQPKTSPDHSDATPATSEVVSGLHVALRVLPQGGENDIPPGKTSSRAPGSEGLLLPQKHGYFLSSRTTGLGLVASGANHPSG